MQKLIVNPGTENAWEIPLRPGGNSLGRGQENDFPIEHSSISNTHCQITVMNSGVIVKDLGSVNGTFMGEKMVTEAVLLPGQILRLGDIEMRFESETKTPKLLASASTIATPTMEEKHFFQQIPEAFSYPLKGNGLILLVSGAVFFGLMSFTRSATGFSALMVLSSEEASEFSLRAIYSTTPSPS